ncbi:MAG: oligosaccharide flippase family protein, partial [Coriobacteriia bacterium]|nr:oligosaccharide flippase family protein [Coriobacteriia bacterium]
MDRNQNQQQNRQVEDRQARRGAGRGAPASSSPATATEPTGLAGPGDSGLSNNPQEPKKQRKPNVITRTVKGWFVRLVDAAVKGSFNDQAEQYASHRTTRDYVWNTLAVGTWGFVFPLLTIIVTQLVGSEQGGMFSMAFVVGTLLMFIGNYGVRTYQVSDLKGAHSFSEYQINRWITSLALVVVGVMYCLIRGYAADMFMISMGVYLYKMIDGLADVYEGRLQQADKLYLAGISLALRSVVVIIVFAACLFITRNLAASCIVMAVAAAVSFVVVTFPLAHFETPKSRSRNLASIRALFKQCFPLFIALFSFALIDAMPRFIMESVLPYDNQLYFYVMCFPASAIVLIIGFVYKPLLLRMANLWADPAKHRKFDTMVIVIIAAVLFLCGVMVFVIATIGIPIMSFLYGIDFESFRGLFYVMLATGGVMAAIDFLYAVITV